MLGKAAQLVPERARIHYNYGLALQQLGRPREAEATLSRALQVDPADPEIVYAMGVLLAKQKQWKQALPYAEKLMELTPGRPADATARADPARARRGPGASMSTTGARAEDLPDEGVRFERLLADLSARFVNLPPSDVDQEIDRGLQQIVEMLDVDRSSLMEFRTTEAVDRHPVVGEGRCPTPHGNAGERGLPWYTSMLLRGEQSPIQGC